MSAASAVTVAGAAGAVRLSVSRPADDRRLVARLHAGDRWIGDLVFGSQEERDEVLGVLSAVAEPAAAFTTGDLEAAYPGAIRS